MLRSILYDGAGTNLLTYLEKRTLRKILEGVFSYIDFLTKITIWHITQLIELQTLEFDICQLGGGFVPAVCLNI